MSYMWKSAKKLLELSAEDKIKLFPPQLIILGCLKDYTTLSHLTQASQKINEFEPILLSRHGH
jgi:hypothetical protein